MKIKLFILSIIAILGLSACANDTSQEDNNANSSSKETMNHEEMNHTGSGEIPEGLKVAENPVYKVGSKAIIKADHMEGMKGAEATIVGAYDTIAYVVSYTPTTGGEMVTNHKWVIQEEIKDAGTEEIASGTEVTLEADHMEGMKGATAEIESAEKTTVYVVDYTPTTGGEKVTNHKWVTESELSDK
ncbi:YdhK family protein [Niallia sp. FSL W8-0635]|uniref:YdhK family protein n=1 Tax=Niallia sp. FSL W8-0635 TaxID=2975337 RepID=UPI0009C49793|nr:sporulation lipoprotein, YhcN/YlaJ family [Mycobacteroides abscessus subsp. abscessus]HEO8418921.1 YdhK family protein [Yersinia enterocolitica]